MNAAYLQLPTKAGKDAAREKICKVLKVWCDWAVYDAKYLNGLEATLVKEKNPFNISNFNIPTTEDDYTTHIISDDDEVSVRLKLYEDRLNSEPEKLDQHCRANGVSVTGTKLEKIERLLWVEKYRIQKEEGERKQKLLKDMKTLENEKKLLLELLPSIAEGLNTKALAGTPIKDLEALLNNMVDFLGMIKKRTQKIASADVGGEELDEFDQKFWDIPDGITQEDLDGSANRSSLCDSYSYSNRCTTR